MTINERIQELLKEGLELKKVRACLVLEDYSNKDIEAAIKELGLSAKAKKGFAAEYYDFLASGVKSKAEAEAFIEGTGDYGETTPNIRKHKSHYLNIWELTIKVWGAKGEEPKEEAKEEANPKVKAAWDKLSKAKAEWAKGKAPRNNGTFHPDKVSHLGDDSLTRAYTKFFQEING